MNNEEASLSYVIIVKPLIIMQSQKHCLLKCNSENK